MNLKKQHPKKTLKSVAQWGTSVVLGATWRPLGGPNPQKTPKTLRFFTVFKKSKIRSQVLFLDHLGRLLVPFAPKSTKFRDPMD